ncbi:MAG: HesA/MoeB/ThiF family protein [Muribaculaceae bacterium]
MDSQKDLRERYSRQIMLPQVGEEGQQRLAQGSVLLVGAGGLGSPAALYLAAAGVGTIGVADGDVVNLSNLARQVAHFTPDLGRPKTDSIAEKMRAINPNISVVTHPQFLDQGSIHHVISQYDFIIDCTDSLCSKYMINDACVAALKPFVIGGVFQFGAQMLTCLPGTACYRCVFPDASATEGEMSCAIAGVMGPVVGMLGCLQATEAVKYLTGAGSLLTDRLLITDTLTMQFHTIDVVRDPACRCSHHS